MTATRSTRETVDELIARLDAERNDPDLMRQRHQELVEEVRGYELKYGMTATEAHAAIDRRELRETQDVCHWLIAAASLEPWDDDQADRSTWLDTSRDLPQSPSQLPRRPAGVL